MDTRFEEALVRLDRVPGRWLIAAVAGLLVIAGCQQLQLQALRGEVEGTDALARDGYNIADKAAKAAEEAQDTADDVKQIAEEAEQKASEAREAAGNAQQTADEALSESELRTR